MKTLQFFDKHPISNCLPVSYVPRRQRSDFRPGKNSVSFSRQLERRLFRQCALRSFLDAIKLGAAMCSDPQMHTAGEYFCSLTVQPLDLHIRRVQLLAMELVIDWIKVFLSQQHYSP